MNRKRIHILFLLVLLLLCTACTERTLEMRQERVPIHLYTSILTRAAVGDFNNTPVRIAYGSTSGNFTEYWDGVATDDEIVLTPKRYYPEDGSTVYLCSYHPLVPLGGNGVLTYELTGSEDLMTASEISGSLTAPFTRTPSKVLSHNHLLTLLKFKACKRNTGGVAGRIYSIRVNEALTSITLSLVSGEAAFSNPAGLSLTPHAGAETPGVEIPANGSTVAVGELLVPPFTLADGYTLNVETSSGTIRNLKLIADTSEVTEFAAGTSHEVTLWLSETELGVLSVTSEAWKTVEVEGDQELKP